MTDQAKADRLLGAYYARRQSGDKVKLQSSDLEEVPEGAMPKDEIIRLSRRLDAEDLINFDPVTDEAGQVVDYGGKIAPKGIRTVEGEELPGAGATHVDNRRFTINDAKNVQAGDHNTQEIGASLRDLALQIQESGATKEEKREASGLMSKLLRNPAVANVLGGTAGEVAEQIDAAFQGF